MSATFHRTLGYWSLIVGLLDLFVMVEVGFQQRLFLLSALCVGCGLANISIAARKP